MIYENICRYAAKRKLSIHQIEKKANIGNGTIRKWKDGAIPSLESLQKVAKVLGVSVTTLLRGAKWKEE